MLVSYKKLLYNSAIGLVMRSSNETNNKIWRTISSDLSGQTNHMRRLRSPIHLHVKRTGILLFQGLHQRAQTMPFLPPEQKITTRRKRWQKRRTETDVHSNMRSLRQGLRSSVPTPPGQTGLLQRMFQRNESHQLISA